MGQERKYRDFSDRGTVVAEGAQAREFCAAARYGSSPDVFAAVTAVVVDVTGGGVWATVWPKPRSRKARYVLVREA